jgi:hypothetical protein
MRKFLRDQNLRKFEFPEECAQHFRYLTEKLHHHKGYQTENCPLDGKQCIDILQICNGRIDIQSELWFSLAGYSLGSPQVIEQLDNDEHQYLSDVYKMFLPGLSTNDVLFFMISMHQLSFH